MRILLAPDKFKKTLSANEVCAAMTEGIQAVDSSIEVISQPLADGGEGTSDLLQKAFGLDKVELKVADPFFQPIDACYLKNEKVAFVEMANASGLELLIGREPKALEATTFGTGELIEHALNQGVEEIYLMIGGSATNDGGTGMAKALGYTFSTSDGSAFSATGAGTLKLDSISKNDIHPRIAEVKFTVLCDVQNPLLGENGASYVYGPQKGATDEDIIELEAGMQTLAKVLDNGFENIPGAGAAGGLGYGAMSFLGAELKPGIQSVMEMTGFEQKLEGVDVIITGEGKMDLQTVEGKVIAGVSEVANKSNIPFGVVCGLAEHKEQVQSQIKAYDIRPLVNEEVTVPEAMANAYQLVKERTEELVKGFVASRAQA